MIRAALHTRVSTVDQKAIPDQLDRLQGYATARGWTVALELAEVASGADPDRPVRRALLDSARRREVDTIIVVRLDRWGRDLADLVTTLRDLAETRVGFVSLAEAIDLTTSVGQALVGLLAEFAEFAEFERDRLRERIAARRAKGLHLGRPPKLAGEHGAEARRLRVEGASVRSIAARLGICRDSVRRLLRRSDPNDDPTPAGSV